MVAGRPVARGSRAGPFIQQPHLLSLSLSLSRQTSSWGIMATNFFVQFTKRDAILYALGIGCCDSNDSTEYTSSSDPKNVQSTNRELRYVYEKHPAFELFPTFLLSLTFQAELQTDRERSQPKYISRFGFGIRPFPPEALGGSCGCIIPLGFVKDPRYIDRIRALPVLHMRQTFNMHQKPIMEETTQEVDTPINVWLETRISSIDPRSIGTFVTSDTNFYQQVDGSRVCIANAEMTALVLGVDPEMVHKYGSRAIKRTDNKMKISEKVDPEMVHKYGSRAIKRTDNKMKISENKTTSARRKVYSYQIPHNAALIYRLSGDYNPIHVEGRGNGPNAMGVSLSERPVLHGLCTLGYAVRAALMYVEEIGSHVKPKMISVECNFVKPVIVGDSLEVVVSDQTDVELQSKKLLMITIEIYRLQTLMPSDTTGNTDFNSNRELVVDKGIVLLSLENASEMKREETKEPDLIARL
jgi:acyl dehydratase